MNTIKVTEMAHALYRSHGDRAELEAAQKENLSKDAGNSDEAARWRAIRGCIRRLRGANQG